MTRFWMVARKPVSGERWGNPTMRHYERDAAVREAQRLADKLGETFVVLGVEEVIAPEGVEPEALDTGGGPSLDREHKRPIRREIAERLA